MSRTRFQEVIAMPALSARNIPQTLKRGRIVNSLTARLKSCPSHDFLNCEFFRSYLSGSLRAALMLLLLVVAMAATSPAQTFKTLYNFCSKANCTDGSDPFYTPLVQGANGDLYGTTYSGGTNGAGTVFKVTPAGKLTTLYNFCSQPSCTDGYYPLGGLLLATDGNFYGVTPLGGAYGDYGTVFRITPAGKLTTLHSFDGTDGEVPKTGLIQATNGNFYGTTQGTAAVYATLFEMTANGTLTTLYSFCVGGPCPTGADPQGLIQGTDGNFYGTTYDGGSNSGCSGYVAVGTFFQLTPSGALNVLADFCAPSRGTRTRHRFRPRAKISTVRPTLALAESEPATVTARSMR